jgi:competence protein ComEA
MFNLTPEERKVILFLIITALAGIGTNFLIKLNSPVKILSCYGQDFGKVDLNSADKNLLTSVPGIGVKLAQRIITYREENGAFKKIEELKNIKGITNYKFEKIKDSFIVKE